MITADQEHHINYVDPSSLSTFARCPAKYYFSRILGLTRPEASMIAPDFGTCIHLALPYCYKQETLDQGIQAFKKAWNDMGYGEDDKKRNTDRATWMLRNFLASREGPRCPYEIVHLPNVAPPGAKLVNQDEVPFLIDIGADLPLAGRIDLVVRWKVTKEIMPCDYKTASEVSDRLFKSFWNAPQTLAYTFATWHLSGEKPPGLAIEAIRVSTKNDETAFHVVDTQEHLLYDFVEWTKKSTERLLKYNARKQWPQNPAGCSSYSMFGVPTFQCPFASLCLVKDWNSVRSCYKEGKPYHPFEIENPGE